MPFVPVILNAQATLAEEARLGPDQRRRRRLVQLAGAGAVALLVAAAVAVVSLRMQRDPLVGTDLNNTPAPPFQLTDQNGQQVCLAQFKGEPAIVTFLYTHCPDACPLIADQVHVALTQLGPSASKVGVLAVSTDPVGDNRQTATDFVRVHSLTGQMHYLLGSPGELQPIWKNYYIGVTATSDPSSAVEHSEAVFLVDKTGKERVLLGVPFRAEDLAADLRRLLTE